MESQQTILEFIAKAFRTGSAQQFSPEHRDRIVYTQFSSGVNPIASEYAALIESFVGRTGRIPQILGEKIECETQNPLLLSISETDLSHEAFRPMRFGFLADTIAMNPGIGVIFLAHDDYPTTIVSPSVLSRFISPPVNVPEHAKHELSYTAGAVELSDVQREQIQRLADQHAGWIQEIGILRDISSDSEHNLALILPRMDTRLDEETIKTMMATFGERITNIIPSSSMFLVSSFAMEPGVTRVIPAVLNLER